jgi:hypothetical protein
MLAALLLALPPQTVTVGFGDPELEHSFETPLLSAGALFATEDRGLCDLLIVPFRSDLAEDTEQLLPAVLRAARERGPRLRVLFQDLATDDPDRLEWLVWTRGWMDEPVGWIRDAPLDVAGEERSFTLIGLGHLEGTREPLTAAEALFERVDALRQTAEQAFVGEHYDGRIWSRFQKNEPARVLASIVEQYPNLIDGLVDKWQDQYHGKPRDRVRAAELEQRWALNTANLCRDAAEDEARTIEALCAAGHWTWAQERSEAWIKGFRDLPLLDTSMEITINGESVAALDAPKRAAQLEALFDTREAKAQLAAAKELDRALTAARRRGELVRCAPALRTVVARFPDTDAARRAEHLLGLIERCGPPPEPAGR